MSQSASSVSADQCGVCPVLGDGLPAAKISKDPRPGCLAESPAPPVEPNSVYWTSAWSTDKTHTYRSEQTFYSRNNVEVCFYPTFSSKTLKRSSGQYIGLNLVMYL